MDTLSTPPLIKMAFHCNAFTDDLNPCLMTCLDGKDVCVEHSDFYDPDIWFERFIFSIDRLRYVFSSPAKIQLIYKKAILDGRIQITRGHFRDLDTSQNPASLVDYYLLCCKQPGVDPFWSNILFKQTIKTILDMHSPRVHDVIVHNRHLLDRFLEPIFNSAKWPFDYMMAQVLFNAVTINHPGHQLIDHPTVSLFQYIKSHPNYQGELLWKHSVHEENLLVLLNTASLNGIAKEKVNAFVSELPAERAAHREKCIKTNQAMREEIREAVWNPAWYLDHEDYNALVIRWGLIH